MTDGVFVADDAYGSRVDTATVLVGSADEYGYPQSTVRALSSGFLITDEHAALLYDDTDEDASKSPAKAKAKAGKKNPSQHRAAKISNTSERE